MNRLLFLLMVSLFLASCVTHDRHRESAGDRYRDAPAAGEGWHKDVGGPPQSLDEKATELRKYSQEPASGQQNKRLSTRPADNPLERMDNQLRAIDSQRR